MTLIAYEAVADEAWARLWEAADDPSHPMRLVTLATVGDNAEPEARVMVLRGASRELSRLWFYTDWRSQKVDQLRERPAVCVVVYDRTRGVQLRVRGTATVEQAGALADRHWSQGAMALQALFASPDPPGRPLKSPDPRLMGMKKSIDAGEEAKARGNFAVIEIAVDSIEWLQVIDPDQRRAIAHAADGWAVQALAP